MAMNIKELREMTGQTQKEFASRFGIPVGTLRRWEYGESTPAPYVLNMIAERIPARCDSLKKIEREGQTYYYDEATQTLMDSSGTKIPVEESFDGVKEQNLSIYVKDLFDAYYDAVNRFNEDCRLDKKENILWG